jgi:hypothetical protein
LSWFSHEVLPSLMKERHSRVWGIQAAMMLLAVKANG